MKVTSIWRQNPKVDHPPRNSSFHLNPSRDADLPLHFLVLAKGKIPLENFLHSPSRARWIHSNSCRRRQYSVVDRLSSWSDIRLDLCTTTGPCRMTSSSGHRERCFAKTQYARTSNCTQVHSFYKTQNSGGLRRVPAVPRSLPRIRVRLRTPTFFQERIPHRIPDRSIYTRRTKIFQKPRRP